MKYLVDAYVLSEPTKPTPDPQVIEWLRVHEPDLAVDPVILGELRFVGYAHALGGPGDGGYEYAFAKMKPGAGTIAPPAGTAEPYSGAIRSLKPSGFIAGGALVGM